MANKTFSELSTHAVTADTLLIGLENGGTEDSKYTVDDLASYIAALPVAFPRVVLYDRLTAQTSNANLAIYTVGATAESLEVSANILITTSTTFSFGVVCGYTDEAGTIRSLPLLFNSNGTIVPQVADSMGVIPAAGLVAHIKAKQGSTVEIKTSGTFTAVTYNFEGVIKITH